MADDTGAKSATSVQQLLRLIGILNRGAQVLLVAHGASLLTLVTTYVGPVEPVPERIKPFIFKFAVGFLLALCTAVMNVVAEAEPLTPAAKYQLRRVGLVAVMCTVATAGSLFALLFAMEDVFRLTN